VASPCPFSPIFTKAHNNKIAREMKHNYLYIIWKNPNTKRNYIVGKLGKTETGFFFEYSDEYRDALSSGWTWIECFPEDKRYESTVLFPVFQSRLPDKKRKDLPQILEKYELEQYDGYELLKNSGGRLPIDTYEFVDPIFDDDRTIERTFYLVVIHDLSSCSGVSCKDRPCLKLGAKLILQQEKNNVHDVYAVQVKTEEGKYLGYIPRYYSRGVSDRLNKGMSYDCTVLDVNQDCNCEECVKVKLLMPKRN
jgi:hypothetical protein